MLRNIKDLDEGLKDFVREEISKVKILDIFVIVNIDYLNYTADIKQLNANLEYKNVNISSNLLGNGKGFLIPPTINDLVLVSFLNGDLNSPVIIGSIFNTNINDPDSILDIREGEVFLGNKTNGSYIFMDEDGNIKFKPAEKTIIGSDLYPDANNTYYIGKNDDDSPMAWKGVILKDTTNGKYYRIEITNGSIVATDLSD